MLLAIINMFIVEIKLWTKTALYCNISLSKSCHYICSQAIKSVVFKDKKKQPPGRSYVELTIFLNHYCKLKSRSCESEVLISKFGVKIRTNYNFLALNKIIECCLEQEDSAQTSFVITKTKLREFTFEGVNTHVRMHALDQHDLLST